LFSWHKKRAKILITLLAIAIPFISSAGALYLFMNPDLINSDTQNVSVTEKFTTGPYPTEAKIMELKKEGYTGVISLLHPAVVPFEPVLLDEEEVLLKKYNMQLIKAPMLPWVADNSSSLKIIEDVAKNATGKYYVHCYLGKDRVNVVKNFILNLSGPIQHVKKTKSRTMETQGAFERGDIYKIDSSTYFPPFPTDEELFAFFLAGDVESVVNLMDSTIEDNKPWIRKERASLQPVGITFKNFAVNESTGAAEIENIIDSISLLPKPIIVHHWNTSSPESKLFRKIYYQKTHHAQMNLATHDTETF